MQKPFAELVRQHFAFLHDEYGFSELYQWSTYDEPWHPNDAVEFNYYSNTAIVSIIRAAPDELSVQLGPQAAPHGLSVKWIVEFLSGGTETLHIQPFVPRETLYSTEEELMQYLEALAAGKDTSPFKKDFSPAEKQRRQDWQEYRLNVYATALHKYGDPFLRGDFAKWDELRKYVSRKIAEDYAASKSRNPGELTRLVTAIKRLVTN